MSKMGLWGAIGFSLALVSLTQIPYTKAQECSIQSITPVGPESLLVKWNTYPGATNYLLDLRVVNSTRIAPVVVTLPAYSTEKVVKGLRPGIKYEVTLKVFHFYYSVCEDKKMARTVPAASQITRFRALSSTSIMLEWAPVASAQHYYVIVESKETGEKRNMTFTEHSTVVENLQPTTTYNCSIYSANQAGVGRVSRVRTVATLVQPPENITVEQTGQRMARVSWTPVDKVLLYRVTVRDADEPNSEPFEANVTSTQLDIRDILPCSTYLVSVSSINTFLEPGESTDYTYTTNPLSPVSNVSVHYSCTMHSAVVSWLAVAGADSYRAMADDKNGTVLSCTSHGTECHITGMNCGQSYMVYVTAMSDSCEDTASTIATTFQTVPCPPKKLQLFRECASNVIVFSWEHTNFTSHYMARAVDSKGVVKDCITTDNSCFFTHTVCGRYYTFTVYSVSGECESQVSPPVSTHTAPCIPQNVRTSADCRSDVLTSTWDLAEGALRYTVEACGNKGNHSCYNCSSLTNSCAMEGVHCGEHLSIYITAFDDECSSVRKLGQVAETVPCIPQNVSANMDCGADSVTVHWKITPGALFYIVTAIDNNGNVHTCNSMSLACSIGGLRCSSSYTAFVIATNLMCNSSDSERVIVETAACPPGLVVASLDCAANQALISWQGEPHMTTFTATVEDAEDRRLNCSTTQHNCNIPGLECSQLYTVSVFYHDGMCLSMPSRAIYMESVPCGPANVQTNVDCASGGLTIGWNASRLAEKYTTIISNNDGHSLNINTTETRLSVSTLECGEEYKVVVLSTNGTCRSLPSKTITIREVPCVPTNVQANRICGESFVEVMWQASRGARNYTAVAVGNDGRRLDCSSDQTACRLDGLMCGQVYSVTVAAVDDNCSSMKSAAVTLQTAPCPPSQLIAELDCTSNSASLTWDASPNAVTYSAKAVGADGHSESCDTGGLGCQLDGLRCGQEYVFTVSASDGICGTPESPGFTLTTAPCAPQNVVNTMDCTTNTLTVSWAPGSIPANYSATAFTRDGTELFCNTEGSSCVMASSQCGLQFTVMVKAVSSTCEGPSSTPHAVLTAPCVPTNPRGVVECSSNTLQASWDGAAGAQSYTSVLSGAGGFFTWCSSDVNECSFPSLQCAQDYTFDVVAVNGQCNSSVSTAFSVVTAPCDPADVTAALNCDSGVVTVGWQASAGAVGYTVLAQAHGLTQRNHVTSCTSAGTSCELTQLHCGELYNVTVLAGDGTCNSTMFARTTIKTAPCTPVIQSHSVDCSSNHALVSWTEDEDAVVVTVNASSTMGHSVSCRATANSSCVIDDLHCGETYTAQAVARGDQCFSAPSSTFQIVATPCTPTNVISTYTCGTSIALLSWDETLGRDSFHIQVQSGEHTDTCDTTETHCSLTSLLCGSLYDVSVDAVAVHCNSSRPATMQIQTAPCAPQNVSASLVCDNNTAAVSWLASPGAVNYTVVAQGRDSDIKSCTTTTTSCHLPHLHCAQTYEITITPYSDSCRGFHSTTLTFIAGPCPPTDVQASLMCDGNLGIVSWVPALAADLYVATAAFDATHSHTCSSSGTGCTFTDLHCDETNAVTVVTVERGCRSEPSAPVLLKSAVCPPSGLSAVTTCPTNDITVSWDPSVESGATYVLHSQKERGDPVTFSTDDTSYVISGMQCGETFAIKSAAHDAGCTSALSDAILIDTAPCPPTNLTAKADCGTNRGTLSWRRSAGAINYTATVTGTHGHTASCSSNATSCFVKLDCGHQYSAFVVASNGKCNSIIGDRIEFASAPCLPDNVVADLDCVDNTFAVTWSESEGDVSAYTAIAIGSDGSRATCDTSTTSCTIQDLRCGLTYSIAVTTASVGCGTIDGSDYQLQSAPCKPESPRVNLECSSNMAVVSWDNAGPDQGHVVSAVINRGATTTCNSTTSQCTFSQLSCGEEYSVSVVGYTERCSSEPSSIPNSLLTAPCVPTHLEANVDCQSGITVIKWDPALGAADYTVHAVGSRGHNGTCTNIDTTCAFSDLECGQDYTITVVAHHNSCDGLASDPIIVTAGPCPHTDLDAFLDCSTNTALVSWTPGSGILRYNATAEATVGTHRLTCSTSGPACNISSLPCGERYRVSVRGEGQTCPSPAVNWVIIVTAPCPPTGLQVESSCDSNDISVAWGASQGSLRYTAVAESEQGHRLSCATDGTDCQISGLQCGEEYQVYAAGIDDECTGAKSPIRVIHTAPCVPHDVQNHLDCLSGDLNITWQQSGHAEHYHATVVSGEGQVIMCESNVTHCVVPGLRCGLNYDVEVEAHDEACNGSRSPAQQVTTAPCPPDTFVPAVDCATNIVSLTWDHSVPGVLYTVSAVDISGGRHSCSETGGGCDLSTLECGMGYVITVTPSRDGCVGRSSPLQLVKTAPCMPRLTEVEMDCLSDSAWVTWEDSAGAEDYVVMVTSSQGVVHNFACNSTQDGTCAVPHMRCSQNMTFTLMARDQQCSSAPSNAIVTETAPCPPQNVQTIAGCDNRTVSVSWSPSDGAVLYTAMLERTDGETACCTSTDTSCDITDLPCGEMYVLLVTAEGRTCNSSQGAGAIVRTEPCIPQNLQASLSCGNNVASMSWNFSLGGQQYRVEAVGADGHMHQCSSHQNTCELTDLHCGQHYTATVVAEHSDCTSGQSDSVDIRTVPCIPANVSSLVDCEANHLTVSWSESSGADLYTATVRDSHGQSTTCQSMTEGTCSVTGLNCGQIYHVSVVSSDGYCDSPPTDVVDTHSAPCEPSVIRATMDCEVRSAVVSWYTGAGAVSYTATASTASGHAVTCATNSTHCELGGLACGQSYSIYVKALGESCNSMAHMTGELLTEPCIPTHITTQYSLTIGQVQWDMSTGAESYTAMAVTSEGDAVSCSTRDTNCPLRNMECGKLYSVTVTAHNQVCHGVASESVDIQTEPCPPNHVETSLHCESAVGTVSWEMSFGAVRYVAHLDGRDGHSLYCQSTQSSCTVEGVHCGTIYYTRVIAMGETLNSSDSNSVLLIGAPCAAEAVVEDLNCDQDTARVSWNYTNGADSYQVTATGSDGHRASCETVEKHCSLVELLCGQTYNISLTAINDFCQTVSNTGVSFRTRPCTPLNLEVDLKCGTSTADLYWEQSEGVELYTTTATDSTGETLHCNSTGFSCQFSSLRCGETYQFSVTAHSTVCQSEVSSTVEMQTEPCQPDNLTVSGSCDNETVVLDWSEARGASVYVVSATGDLGYITAFQTDETSLEALLLCGQTFTITVMAQSARCNSPVSQPAEFRTAPCVPQHVESYTHCENNLGAVSWAQSDGADSYTAVAVGQDGHTHVCTSNTTKCSWDDLHCGERYLIHVTANDFQCSSGQSDSTPTRMAPCVPQNLESSLDCSTKVGTLTWDASETAESYLVTAETNSGHKLELSTNDTVALISDFWCGQEYFLSVVAIDSVCRSGSSQPEQLTAVPCPPTGVSSSMDCLTNIAVVTWTNSAGAEFYTATVMNENGLSQSCMSANEQCGMPNLRCGLNYTVTVTASDQQCSSDPSEVDTLQSVPCVPTDVEVTVNCNDNAAAVSWNASQGALSYKVVAESSQGVPVSSCESTEPGCTLTNLTCGQSLQVQVVAIDDICSSLPSQATQFHTVPCTPNIGAVVLDCYTNSALLDWFYAEGALSYTATALSASGHVSTCTTNFTNCELLELQCGQTYTVTLVASDSHCDSPRSASVQVTSVPCSPEGVMTTLDCSSNTAHVEWLGSNGADSYIVQAFGVEADLSGCETDSLSCVVPDLMCGFTYNISVIAVNSVCNMSESAVTQLNAAPCVPNFVQANVDCESGAVAVTWEPSKGANSYTTVAQGNGGYASTCNSSETSCLFSDLLCGLSYSITVNASDDQCTSAGSSTVHLNSVPCVPQGVDAKMMCSDDTGLVSWEQGEGVASYLVRAVGPDGHRTQCNSTATSCQLHSMHCGQSYNLTVTAQDGLCDNSNAYLTLQSVPCGPTNTRASLQCRSNSAAVTWERASGAHSYHAVGVTADGSHQTECNNTVTHCDLSSLVCGQTYNVTTFSHDESCNSVESNTAFVQSGPCTPQDVAVDVQCDAGAMVVSWAANPDAESFHVEAISSRGAYLSCDSSSTRCSIDDLPCGQSYNITVVSIRDGCRSEPSATVEASSAPCVPRNPEGSLDCVTNSAWVSWDSSDGALSYTVWAQGVGGHNATCSSTSTSCNVPDLKCGTLYTFHITAFNTHCRSPPSTTFQLETGPCALTSITAVTECHSETILVGWEMTEDSPLYLVTAEGQDQSLISCNSSSDSCALKGARCGMQYSIIVSASSDKCSSLRSPPKKIHTAPCLPVDVKAVASCEDNGAVVSWARSIVATSYMLTATGRDGDVKTCNTSLSNCTLADLHCGQLYTFSVTAGADNCTSPPRNVSFRTVPCEPSGLAVDFQCESNSAVVSWDASEGTVEYFGCAKSGDGDMLYCESAGASCTIHGLECGDMYNFSVEASNGICNSSLSAPLLTGAVPCPPDTINVRIQPIEDAGQWVMLSWDRVDCAEKYLVEMTGQIEGSAQAMIDITSYWWERPYFEFPIPCSTSFSFTIRSRNSAGASKPSRVVSGATAPCPPQNVTYTGDSQSAVVSWEASVFATRYTVYNGSGEGRVELCSTTELSCELSNFEPAGVKVTASSAVGESLPNSDITGPVRNRRKRDMRGSEMIASAQKKLSVPQGLNITVTGVCLHLEWRPVMDATQYTIIIKEEQAMRHTMMKTTDEEFYTECELKTCTSYCVFLSAQNPINQSNVSKPVCRTTSCL